MESDPPTWLDKTFLATVLQGEEHSKPCVTIVEFTAKLAVEPGNNYTSTVFRVLTTYTVGESSDVQSVSLIVKVPHEKGFINKMAEKFDFFGLEPKVYNELLPKMYKKIKCEFGPITYFCPLKNGMVLKDLTSEGYMLCDRFKQLDFAHCKYVFNTLAKFHATSVALHHEDPKFIELLGEEHIYVEGPVAEDMKAWFGPVMKHFVEILNEMNDGKELAEFISKKADCIWELLLNVFKRKENSFNVLNHGDCWISNMMFKHNSSGEPVDVKLIDYQVLRYTTPAIDLLYFMWTSGNEEVRENHQDELYSIYLKTLNQTLENLGCEERLTAEDLFESLKSATDWALLIVTNTLPFMVCEKKDVIDTENFDTEAMKTNKKVDDNIVNIYKGKHFRALLPGIIRQFNRWISS